MCATTALTGCERLTCHTHPITAVCKSTVDSNVNHVDRFGESLIETIKPALKDGTFWSLYDVTTSPADGHCLIHSLARCVNSQTVQFCDTMTLLRHLHFEIITNATYYLSYIKGGTCRHLFSGMEWYIYITVSTKPFSVILFHILCRMLWIWIFSLLNCLMGTTRSNE